MSNLHRAAALAAALTVAGCRDRAEGAAAPSGPPSLDDRPSAPAAAATPSRTPGPCDTTLERFDPSRVYEVLRAGVRDVEERGRIAFGIVGFHRAWIVGHELVYDRDGPKRFRPDPYREDRLRPSWLFCDRVHESAIPDPPLAPGDDPCGAGLTRHLLSTPEGGTVRECADPPGRLKQLQHRLLNRPPPPPERFLITVDGDRIPIEPGEGLVHAGRAGRLLLAAPGGVRVFDRNGRGEVAALSVSTTTPVRATDDGFLVVDITTGVPVASRINRAGATRLGAYPVTDGLRWVTPFAVDGSGRLYGMAEAPGSLKTKLVRAALGDSAMTELAEFELTMAPVNLVTGL